MMLMTTMTSSPATPHNPALHLNDVSVAQVAQGVDLVVERGQLAPARILGADALHCNLVHAMQKTLARTGDDAGGGGCCWFSRGARCTIRSR